MYIHVYMCVYATDILEYILMTHSTVKREKEHKVYTCKHVRIYYVYCRIHAHVYMCVYTIYILEDIFMTHSTILREDEKL